MHNESPMNLYIINYTSSIMYTFEAAPKYVNYLKYDGEKFKHQLCRVRTWQGQDSLGRTCASSLGSPFLLDPLKFSPAQKTKSSEFSFQFDLHMSQISDVKWHHCPCDLYSTTTIQCFYCNPLFMTLHYLNPLCIKSYRSHYRNRQAIGRTELSYSFQEALRPSYRLQNDLLC